MIASNLILGSQAPGSMLLGFDEGLSFSGPPEKKAFQEVLGKNMHFRSYEEESYPLQQCGWNWRALC